MLAVHFKPCCCAHPSLPLIPRPTLYLWTGQILDRNYKHHEKVREPESQVFYNADALYNSRRYGTLAAEVEVSALQGMAPQHLVDLVKGFDNTYVQSHKKSEFEAWNTVGFEGGGSSMEFMTSGFNCKSSLEPVSSIQWQNQLDEGDVLTGTASACITGSEVITDRDEPGQRAESSYSNSLTGGMNLVAVFPILPITFQADFDDVKTWSSSSSKSVVVTTTITEDSSTMFHLEDPNSGDYFVVSVWSEYVSRAVQFQGEGVSTRFRLLVRTYAPWAVRVDGQTNQEKH